MPKASRRVNTTFDQETLSALRKAAAEDGVKPGTKAKVLVREGLRRDGYLLIEKARTE